ncbi:MAG TPA: ABC transporter ATP-binding protein, partial [Chthonomonadaceae bacterium]|nr:ABC transporter ATP-binding protein [Chthonomonadaceae bacterium]
MNDRPDTMRRLLGYLKPHLGALIGGLLCAAVTAGITVGIAKFIELALDSMRSGNIDRLSWMCVTVVVIFLIKGVFSFGQSYLLSLVANRAAMRLRDDIYAHLQHLSLSFFNTRRTGAILSTLTNDVPVLQNAAMSLKDAIASPITVLLSLAGLFYYSWRLAIISLIFIPFMAIVIQHIGKRIRRISAEIQEKLADLTTIIEETVSGVRIIKSFAAENKEIARFGAENHRTMKTVMRGVRKSSLLRPLTEFIGAFGIALVLFLGGQEVVKTNGVIARQRTAYYRSATWLAAVHASEIQPDRPLPKEPEFQDPNHGLTQGGLMAFVFLLNALARTAGDIGGMVTLANQSRAAAKRIFDQVLDIDSEVQERAGAIALPKLSGHVRFENVSFRYAAQGPDVLTDVSFDARPGEVIALVGRSGSGKSTLVDLIPRFYDPTAGRILVDGVDVRDVQLERLRTQIGIVPQETWLFAGTLRDNIAYGNRAATDEEVRSAAYAANAAFIESMPQRFDTIVGERGIRLSGGERQRIAIARAILMNPRILILDEATSSLDASSEALVQEALDGLMKGRTTIVIAHRLSTVVNADRILVIDRGVVLESGSHKELVAAGGKYAELY